MSSNPKSNSPISWLMYAFTCYNLVHPPPQALICGNNTCSCVSEPIDFPSVDLETFPFAVTNSSVGPLFFLGCLKVLLAKAQRGD